MQEKLVKDLEVFWKSLCPILSCGRTTSPRFLYTDSEQALERLPGSLTIIRYIKSEEI